MVGRQKAWRRSTGGAEVRRCAVDFFLVRPLSGAQAEVASGCLLCYGDAVQAGCGVQPATYPWPLQAVTLLATQHTSLPFFCPCVCRHKCATCCV